MLRERLGGRFFLLSEASAELARRTVRASSIVENINSRLRSYFFLRRHLGPDYLALLQFFLNHRRFLRSERVGKRQERGRLMTLMNRTEDLCVPNKANDVRKRS